MQTKACILLGLQVAAERGADPDQLKEVQAFVAVKHGRQRGPLDFQQAGGLDTSWTQVGVHDAAGMLLLGCMADGWP